jgi:O-methyltransferase
MNVSTPEPHPGLVAAREARALAPRSDVEALRTAYLELLKLCLCDLAGAGTTSVGATEENVVMSRELPRDQLRLRAAGMDWPLHGLTMIGLNRLDDLQRCVESVVREGVEGDLIEAGAWRGGAGILMRATLDSLGAADRTVWVADSFQGFPVAEDEDRDRYDWAAMDYLAVPLEEVRGNFARLGFERGVSFLPGFFEETLSGLSDKRWSIVRLDVDTYETTKLALQDLYPRLGVGGYLMVDDYGALEDCRRAVDEFRSEHEIAEPLEEVDWTCVRWRRETEAGMVEVPVRSRPRVEGNAAPRGIERRRDVRVPTARELELARQVDALRKRLEAAQTEIGWLRGSPLRAPHQWLRRKLKRGGKR